MSSVKQVALVFLTIVFILYIYYIIDDVAIYKSSIDGKLYEVRNTKKLENLSNDIRAETAANYLALLSQRINFLVNHMYKNSLPDKETSERLYNRWKTCKLRETGSTENSVAYTVNKGEELRVCIRTNNKLEELNNTMFVILHELAHIMSISYGHNEEFRENFSYIIHLASNVGIYKPHDFTSKPIEYCGTEINTTPCSSGTCKFIKSDNFQV